LAGIRKNLHLDSARGKNDTSQVNTKRPAGGVISTLTGGKDRGIRFVSITLGKKTQDEKEDEWGKVGGKFRSGSEGGKRKGP